MQGAHVVAFNPKTGKLVGGFTLTENGDFVIAGLEPGPQVLRAEPLDDGDVNSFFDDDFEVDLDFRVAFYERIVAVPRRRWRPGDRDQGDCQVSAAAPKSSAGGVAFFVLVLAVVVVTPAAAQPVTAARGGRLELSGGGVLVGGYGLGESVAELTPNSGSSRYELFTTESEVRQAFGGVARIGFAVTPAFVIEGGLRFARPVYQLRVSGDAENAPDATLEETLSQYVFDGSVVWNFGGAGRRLVPFVYGGAGYLRELHEEDALVAEGVEYHAGGGVKWWLGESSRRFGLRGDVGVSVRDGGFDFGEGPRAVPVVGVSLIYTF